MTRLVAVILIGLCVCGPWPAIKAQTPRSDRSNVLKQLLDKPAPRPLSQFERTEPDTERPDEFYDENKNPPDDAPIEDLIDYWSRFADQPEQLPTDAVQQRLLDASLGDPLMVAKLIELFPQTEATAARIKEVYDKLLADRVSDFKPARIKNWLVYHSKYFIDELVASANKVRDADSGYVENEAALAALTRFNWELAEPSLRKLLTSTHLRTAALATSLFYQHAILEKDSAAEERYRKALKAIASDQQQPGDARNTAIQNLSSAEWSGRDEWYLGLFHDKTLLNMVDGTTPFSPLTTIFASDPDKWIPVMTRLVEGNDVTVRSAAVTCLVTLHTKSARRDALLPLLPWLSDLNWATTDRTDRLQLIRTMGVFDLPESVPGLIWTAENGPSSFDRSLAAEALAKYKDPRALPALRKALTLENELDHRRRIVGGLIESDGFTNAELLQALEVYATKCATEAGRQEIDRYLSSRDPLSIQLTVGDYLNVMTAPPESLVQAVLTRADELKSTNPPVAQSLLTIAHRWQGRQIDLDLIRRIGNESADADTIVGALLRRYELRKSVRSEMYSVSAMSGPAQGVAAALLEDPVAVQGVLGSDDQFAQVALLACARLVRVSLPVNLIGPLLGSRNALLELAAKSYLLSEDSREAREILWNHFPNQAFMTGWGENTVVESHAAILKAEVKLRDELFKENGPVEILAWIRTERLGRVLRIYRDKAVFTAYDDPARYREGTISQSELAAFKQFLTAKGVADSGPQLAQCYDGCSATEFLGLTKEKGRRVYVENRTDAWIEVEERFKQLGEDAQIHYNLEKQIKGLEVLIADEQSMVRDVWQQGDEVRIFVERPEIVEVKTPDDGDDFDDFSQAARVEYWRRRVVRRSARFSWQVYTNNKPGAVTSQPAIYSTIDEIKFPPHEDLPSFDTADFYLQRVTADSIVIAAGFYGLWKQLAGTKAVRIGSEGFYYAPVVTPDGKYVVLPKADTYGPVPRSIVRFNLQTDREFRVNLERAIEFDAVAYVPVHGKVLLRRAKDLTKESSPGAGRVEYYLLDPSTGDIRLVSGEFEPLHHRGRRFLQPTDKPNEFWAAIPRNEKKETQVGRYDVKDFTFKPLFAVPEILFDSMSMWVDVGAKQIYVVYKDQLLRLPLTEEKRDER